MAASSGAICSSLHGAHVAFSFADGAGTTDVSGEVVGSEIDAKVTRKGRTADYVGTRS